MLVAIAPVGVWTQSRDGKSAIGVEFFFDATHAATDLRQNYRSSWRAGDRDGRPPDGGPGYAPKQIAACISTSPGPSAAFKTAAEGAAADWEIRSSYVTAPLPLDGDAWLSWITPE